MSSLRGLEKAMEFLLERLKLEDFTIDMTPRKGDIAAATQTGPQVA
jgi:hypothetical protein